MGSLCGENEPSDTAYKRMKKDLCDAQALFVFRSNRINQGDRTPVELFVSQIALWGLETRILA